jgi:hypothetical protein
MRRPEQRPGGGSDPPRPDQAPIARAGSAGRNDACRIARLPGVSRAAPAPCRTRVMIKSVA